MHLLSFGDLGDWSTQLRHVVQHLAVVTLVHRHKPTTRHVRRVERVETSVSSCAVPTWQTTNKI